LSRLDPNSSHLFFPPHFLPAEKTEETAATVYSLDTH
jgi:hypothetical protein